MTQPASAADNNIAMSIQGITEGTLPEGQTGEPLVIQTSRGDIPIIVHRAPDSRLGVVWVDLLAVLWMKRRIDRYEVKELNRRV